MNDGLADYVSNKIAATAQPDDAEIYEGSLTQAVDDAVASGQEIKMIVTSKNGEPGRDDWMTPDWLLDIAYHALGGFIDTDPATSEEAQARIEARAYYTKSMNGLDFPWYGSVFMNPPYSRGVIDEFVDKLIVDFDAGFTRNAFVITNNVTETAWAHNLLSRMSALCMVKGRVHFILPGGKEATQTRQGQILWYLGQGTYNFEAACRDIGVVLSKR